MASTKNKKGALLFLLVSIFLGVTLFGMSGFAEPAFAQLGADANNRAADIAGVQNSDNVQEVDNAVITAIKYLLYWLLLILVGFVQVAASVFAWATKPEFISGPYGLLNLESVYELWKFIRDFFNLFFIFLLLFSAFATVFQVEQYGLKKNFFKIVFAAIVINFSFPITRIIIDLGNVPMYFFADGIVSGGASKENNLVTIPMAFFQTTGMGEILTLPSPSKTGTLPALLSGVIFTFIFMITLFTLALLFVLRLLKLIILLIFSPLGIATSIVPGLQKFGKQWWSSLIQTVFFGPAAMLMVVVALRFTAEIQNSQFATGLSASAPAANAASQSSIITQGIFFIPIILMWMAMHVGSKFGIEGSSAVIKKADAVATWGKKQALFRKGSVTRWAASPVTTRVGGAYKGLKKGAYEGQLFGKNYGNTKLGKLVTPKKYKERGEDVEASYKGFVNKGVKGADLERRKSEERRLQAKIKEFKDDHLERTDLETKLLTEGNETERRAAAMLLAESKEGIKKKPEVLRTALEVMKGRDDFEKFEKILKAADDDSLGMSPKQFEEIFDDPQIQTMYAKGKGVSQAEAKKTLITDFGKQIKKVGGDMDKLFIYQAGVDSLEDIPYADFKKLYEDHKFTMKDLSQQSALLRDKNFQAYAAADPKGKLSPTQVSELAKFVAQNNKNDASLHLAVENLKKAIEARDSGKKPTVSDGGKEYTETSGGILTPK